MARWWEDEATLERLEQIARRKAELPGESAATGAAYARALQRPAPEPTATIVPAQGQPVQQVDPWRTYQMTPARQVTPASPASAASGWTSGWQDAGAGRPQTIRSELPVTPAGAPALADFGQRVREAWESIGAPREAMQLGATLDARQAAREQNPLLGITGGWGRLATQAQASAQPTAGQPAAEPQPKTLPGLIRPLWHDVQQLPLIGTPARRLGAVVNTGLAALNLPAEALEQGLAAGTLVGAERLAALMREDPQLAQTLQGSQYDAARVWVNLERDGYSADQIRSALRETERIAYSGPEAVERAARRLLGGESPEAVTQGRSVDAQAPSREDYQAYVTYIRGVYDRARTAGASEGRARAMAAAAEAQVRQRGQIPGEAVLARELVGQMVMDPLNVIDAASDLRRVGQTVRRAEQSLGVVPEAARAASEAAQAMPGSVAPGLSAVLQDVVEAAPARAGFVADLPDVPEVGAMLRQANRLQVGAEASRTVRAAVQRAVPEQWRTWAARTWDRINPFALTDESRIRLAIDDAGAVVGTVVAQSQSADEAVDLVRRFVSEPATLRNVVGDLPEWARGQDARVLLAKVSDQVEEFPSVKAAKASGGTWNPGQFLLDLDAAVLKASLPPEEAAKASGALLDYRRFVEGFRGLMSEFYLRTPGYAIRNAMGDLTTMATDGLLSIDGWGTVSKDLERIGPTTQRVQRALRGTEAVAQTAEIGARSRLGQIVGSVFGEGAGKAVGGASEGIGRFMASGSVLGRRTVLGEETRYAKAFHSGLMRALGETWQPAVPAELAELLGPVRTRALEQGLARALNQQEMLDTARRVVSGENTADLFDYSRYLGDQADAMSVELVRMLDEGLRGATTPDEAVGVFDGIIKRLDEDLGRVMAGDPLPPVRRMNTHAERLQDAAEDAATLEGAAKAAGVSDEAAQAAAAAHQAQMATAQAEVEAAEMALMEQARQALDAGADPRALANALRSVRTDAGQIQMATRTAVDQARQKVYQQLRALLDSGLEGSALAAQQQVVWNSYYDTVRTLRGDEHSQVQRLLMQLQNSLAQGRVPELAEDATRSAVQRYRAQVASLQARRERLGRLGQGTANLADDEPEFAALLEGQRLAVDEAQAEAWRVALMNPSSDALDIVTQAERDVQALGAAGAARAEGVYEAWRRTWNTRKPWTKAEFRERVDAVWQPVFAQQAGRMDMARRELFALPIGESARATLLQTLGWPADAAAELAPETALLVLRERVAWDVATGGPLIPLEQVQEWTLSGVARQLGIDVSDPRLVVGADWTRIAEQATRDATLYRALTNDADLFHRIAETGGAATGRDVVRGVQAMRAADPGFAERMERGAALLDEVARSAQARARLGTRGLGQTLGVIPEGAQAVERTMVGDLVEVRVIADGKTLARATFENPADAYREAVRIQDEIRRGAGVPLTYVPQNTQAAAARFGIDPSKADEWARLAEVARSRAGELMQDVSAQTDVRRRALFDEAVEQARRLRGSNAEDEARYAQGMLPKGFGLGGETQYDRGVAIARGIEETTDEWYQALSIKAEDAEALTEIGRDYGDRVLQMAGMSEYELGKLQPQQRRRLLEELAQGQLLQTQSGAAQIDGLTPERRQRMLREAGEDLQRLAQGAVADPGRALAYEWLAIADEATARNEAARLLEAEFILPGDVERIVADSDARAQLMDALDSIVIEPLDAVDEKQLTDSIARILTGADAEVEEAVRRLVAGGMDPWEAAGWAGSAYGDKAARARLLERAGIDGGMLVEEILDASKLAGHAVEPPTLADMADVVVEQQKRMLAQIRDGMLAEWPALQAQQAERLAPWVRNRTRVWAQGDLQRQWTQARTVAVESARQMADFALLDYGKRRRVDTLLGLVVPYSYWSTRSARNWALRLMQKPATLAHYARYRQAMKRENERRGYRSRFEGAVEIQTDRLPEWMGGNVLVNPETIFFPFAGLAPNDWEDPTQARNGIDYAYRTLGRYGFRPHGFIEVGLRAADLIGDPQLPGERQGAAQLLDVPQVRMVQGAAALMRDAGQGPVAGSRLREWDSYRISRMLSNMAAQAPGQTTGVLLAQALLERVAFGDLTAEQALQPSAAAERLAEANGWSEDDLAQGQALLGEAWLRMQQEAAIPTLTSGLMGMSARVYPEGERQQVVMQRELAGTGYSPLTGTGSRALMEAYRAQHPETYTRTMAGQLVPGATEPETGDWTPQQARATLLYRPEKEQAQAELERAGLAALASGGIWTRDGLTAARDTYSQTTTAARERLGLGEYVPAAEWSARYGSTPGEALGQAEDTVLGAISAARPSRADFETQTDYARALRAFYSAISAGDWASAAVALPESLPQRTLQWAQGLTEQDLQAYWRENDTLAEALQNAWGRWYGEQWERYNQAKGPDITERMPQSQADKVRAQAAEAWTRLIEEGQATPAQIARMVREEYGDRWSAQEIREALRQIELPTTYDAWLARKTPEERAEYEADQTLRDARSTFWDAFWSLPEDATWKETKGQPLVAMILSRDSRNTATAEQYEMAAAVLTQWIKDHGGITESGERESGQSGKSGGTTKRTTSGGTSRSSGGSSRSRSGGAPAAVPETWEAVAPRISSALRRQLADLWLRGRSIEDGGLAELQALMTAMGWGGTLDELIELLRTLWRARTTETRAPRGKYR